jgi:hypothetical protein
LQRRSWKKGARKGDRQGRQEAERQASLGIRRQTLLRLLRRRFGELPPDAEAIVQQADNADLLDAWLDRVVTAKTFEQVGIGR